MQKTEVKSWLNLVTHKLLCHSNKYLFFIRVNNSRNDIDMQFPS